jgi:hypothetical protein
MRHFYQTEKIAAMWLQINYREYGSACLAWWVEWRAGISGGICSLYGFIGYWWSGNVSINGCDVGGLTLEVSLIFY